MRVATLFPNCHLTFVLALSHSVTVVGDQAVLPGIMQIVPSAVRVLLMQSFRHDVSETLERSRIVKRVSGSTHGHGERVLVVR